MYLKRVKYRNSLGELDFDGRRLYCEEIDCCGLGSISSSEQLMSTHGTKTSSVYLAGRSIPCRFKLVDLDDDADLRERVVRMLSPLIEGTLEVRTELATYTIRCRPTEMPVIKRTDVFYVWQWDTTFYADYPLWQRGNVMHTARTPDYTEFTVYSGSGVEVPMIIRFYGNTSFFRNVTQGTIIGLQNFPSGAQWVEVNTKEFTVKDDSGTDRSYCINPDYNIGGIKLLPGNNTILCSVAGVDIRWYDYALGVI